MFAEAHWGYCTGKGTYCTKNLPFKKSCNFSFYSEWYTPWCPLLFFACMCDKVGYVKGHFGFNCFNVYTDACNVNEGKYIKKPLVSE